MDPRLTIEVDVDDDDGQHWDRFIAPVHQDAFDSASRRRQRRVVAQQQQPQPISPQMTSAVSFDALCNEDESLNAPSPYRAALRERLQINSSETVYQWPASKSPQPQRCQSPQPMPIHDVSPHVMATPMMSEPSPAQEDGCRTPKRSTSNIGSIHFDDFSSGPSPMGANGGTMSKDTSPYLFRKGTNSVMSPFSVGTRSPPPATPPPTRSPYMGGTREGSPISPAPENELTTTFNSMAMMRSPTPNRQSSFNLLPMSGSAPSRILDAEGLDGRPMAQTVAWGPYSHTLVIALGPLVYLWAPDSGVALVHEGENVVSAVACTIHPRPTIALGLHNGLIHRYYLTQEGRGPSEVVTSTEQTSSITSLRFDVGANGESILVCGAEDGTLLWFDVKRLSPIRNAYLKDGIVTIAISPDHSHTAVATRSNGIVVYHASNMTQPTVLEAEYENTTRPIAWLAQQHVGTLAFADGREGSVLRVVSLGSGQITSKETGGRILQIVWSTLSPQDVVITHDVHNDQHISCCLSFFSRQNDNRLRHLRSIPSHGSPPVHLVLSHDGTTLVTGSSGEDTTLRFWKAFAAPPPSAMMPPSPNHATGQHPTEADFFAVPETKSQELEQILGNFGFNDFDDELR